MTRFIPTALVSLVLLGSVAATPVSAAKSDAVGVVTVDGIGSFSALSFAFGMQQSLAASTGQAGSPQLSGLIFTKTLDQTSPLLLLGIASETRYSSAHFEISGGRSSVVTSFALTGVRIASIAQIGGGADGVPTEQTTLIFDKIVMQATGSNGTTSGAWQVPASSSWDLSKNTRD